MGHKRKLGYQSPKYMGDTRINPAERYQRARTPRDRQDAAGYKVDRWGNRLLARTLSEENQVAMAKSQISKEGKTNARPDYLRSYVWVLDHVADRHV